jgi:predicted acylesterase/phospholipase RssA
MLKTNRTKTKEKYHTVVLSGGGIKGVAMLGAMEYLKKMRFLDDVDNFIGTSVGAVVAAVMCMQMDPLEVFENHIENFRYVPDVDITRLERTFGFDSGKNLDMWLATLIPEGMTFGTLFETHGKSLTVCVTNLNTRRAEYLSKETAKNMSIRLALRMTCSVPLYFAAVPHSGSLYVDGGVACNFPLEHAVAVTQKRGERGVLGIKFSAAPKPPGYKWGLESFLICVMESSINRHPHYTSATVMCLETGSITMPLTFKITPRESRQLYVSGGRQAEGFFKKHQ